MPLNVDIHCKACSRCPFCRRAMKIIFDATGEKLTWQCPDDKFCGRAVPLHRRHDDGHRCICVMADALSPDERAAIATGRVAAGGGAAQPQAAVEDAAPPFIEERF